MVLGAMEELTHIESESYSIQTGDVLCMFTDGLFDSSMHEELVIHAILSESQSISAQEVMENIEKRISIQNKKQASDDKTLLLISIV